MKTPCWYELKSDVCANDMWVLLLSCVRYSMGRRTYMSSLSGDLVKKYKHVLADTHLRKIQQEVISEYDIEMSHEGNLGMLCDVDSWENFIIWIDCELWRRDKSGDNIEM